MKQRQNVFDSYSFLTDLKILALNLVIKMVQIFVHKFDYRAGDD